MIHCLAFISADSLGYETLEDIKGMNILIEFCSEFLLCFF